MTYSEAIRYLQSLQVFGARFGLETPRKLAELSGQPQEQLRFIHVAGTNGKGSVCAMLESIYRAAGLKVGLYTSPHLVSFRERIQINRQLISEADVARHTCELMELAKQLAATSASARAPASGPAALGAPVSKPARAEPEFGAPLQPTFFEFVTLMALRHFAEQKCDLVIWETGLGGRLDATNIVTPLASVITNIGHDHQQWLGSTLAEIAFEKAGIIKRGVPVVTSVEQSEALAVITEAANRKDSPLTVVRSAEAIARFPGDLKLPLLGDHQKVNAALAVATVGVLHRVLRVTAETLRHGLECVPWSGRLQFVTTSDGRRWLLDGAHNPEGVESLCRVLEDLSKHSWGEFPLRDEESRASVPDCGGPLPLSATSGKVQPPAKAPEDWRTPRPGGESLGVSNTTPSTPHPASGRPLPSSDEGRGQGEGSDAKRRQSSSAPKTLIVGVLADKDWQGMARRLAPLFGEIHAVPVGSGRSLPPAQLAEALRAANPAARVHSHESPSQCLTSLASTAFTVVTGSLYLVGEVMEWLGISASPAEDERGLNEWNSSKRGG